MFGLRKHLAGLTFDRRHDIETNRDVQRDDLTGMPSRIRRHAGDYSPTNPALFARIVRASRLDPQMFSFVDLGSGKGRVVIAATGYGFRRVVGIEADKALHETAEKNLTQAGLKGNANVSAVYGDARTAPLPPGNLFVFMYSPFRGPIFEAVAKRLADLARDAGRAIFIAYSADWEAEALERTGAFTRVRLRRRQFWARSTVSLFYNDAALRLQQ
jgi:protein-L-isoaspartate O-methyltransferase